MAHDPGLCRLARLAWRIIAGQKLVSVPENRHAPTYMFDIPLTTEFALTQLPGGGRSYAAPEAERSPGHRGGETVRAGLRP
jgi:hypothetical protein